MMLEKVDATFLDQTAREGDQVPTVAHFEKIFSTLAILHANCWGKTDEPVRAHARIPGPVSSIWYLASGIGRSRLRRDIIAPESPVAGQNTSLTVHSCMNI